MDVDTREKRKSLQKAYKEADEIGCVSLYENQANGRYLIVGEPNLRGAESRFQFSQSIGSCVNLLLQDDWKKYGPQAFTFSILDTLKKEPDQSLKDFKDELKALAELYKAGRDPEKSY